MKGYLRKIQVNLDNPVTASIYCMLQACSAFVLPASYFAGKCFGHLIELEAPPRGSSGKLKLAAYWTGIWIAGCQPIGRFLLK